MKQIIFFAFCLIWFQACASGPVELRSPDGKSVCSVECTDGVVTWSVKTNGRTVLLPSILNPAVDGKSVVFSLGRSAIVTSKELHSSVQGEWSQIEDRYSEATIHLDSPEAAGTLHVRLYDNMAAWRMVLNPKKKDGTIRDIATFQLPEGTEFFAPNDDRAHFGPMTLADMGTHKYFTPFLCRLQDGYAMIHEVDLRTLGQLLISASGDGKSLEVSAEGAPFTQRLELPWRVIAFADNIAGIYAAKKNFRGMAPPPPADSDFSWVKPGISLWCWRVAGASYGDFTYKPDTKSYLRLIDHASQFGMPYLLLDAWWSDAANGRPLEPADGVDIEKIVAHARNKGVGLWLYYDLKYTQNGQYIDFDTVARRLSEMGAVGVKYGFLGRLNVGPKSERFTGLEKVRQTYEKIAIAAKYRLMIDFHDTPVPLSGVERTLPNYMTREYCHAQMDSRTAFSPDAFVKTALIDLWAGSIDQANGVYSPEVSMTRDRGPKNPLYTTISSENARVLITHTGTLTVLSDAPEEYLKHADMFSFIRQMPATWDDTRMVDADYPRFLTMARRSGERWFVGTVFNEEGGSHTLRPTFLEPGKTYRATLFMDAPDAHYMTARQKYRIEKRNVTAGETIAVDVVPGGGYSVLFEPVQ